MGRWYNTTFMGLMAGSGGGYAEKVLGLGPIAYWPLWELSGVTAQCLVNPAQNGTYTGVTLGQPGIGDGNTSPLFDGANDFVNIYSAPLAAAFDGDEGSMACWVRVFNVGVWTDVVIRSMMILARALGGGTAGWVRLYRPNPNNNLRISRQVNAVNVTISDGGHSEVNFFHCGMTWSRANNQLRFYVTGTEVAASPVALPALWVGPLLNTACVIGAIGTGGGNHWYGWLAHCAVWDTPLSPAVMADLATI